MFDLDQSSAEVSNYSDDKRWIVRRGPKARGETDMGHLWRAIDPVIATSGEPTTHLVLTLGTAVTVGVVIFVTAFLFGLGCGWMRHEL
jgi:hypothetical protein